MRLFLPPLDTQQYCHRYSFACKEEASGCYLAWSEFDYLQELAAKMA